jgi:hypothetical protein
LPDNTQQGVTRVLNMSDVFRLNYGIDLPYGEKGGYMVFTQSESIGNNLFRV